jgi:hypothetical protein
MTALRAALLALAIGLALGTAFVYTASQGVAIAGNNGPE